MHLPKRRLCILSTSYFLYQTQGHITPTLQLLWIVITMPIKIAQIDDKNVSFGQIPTQHGVFRLYFHHSLSLYLQAPKNNKIKSNPINEIRTVEFVTKLLIYSISFNPHDCGIMKRVNRARA